MVVNMAVLTLHHPAWIEINLRQFQQNLLSIRQHIGKSLLCLPVKANAYGHGLIPIAKAAVPYVDYLAVSCLQEGVHLRQAGIKIPILVFGAIHADQISALLYHQLEFTLASAFKAELVQAECERLGQPAMVHLEVETGMQRTGMRPETALQLFQELQHAEHFVIKGIYSHLATSDFPSHTIAQQQIASFKQLAEQIKKLHSAPVLFHLANSGAVCYYPEAWLDMVRPGLLSYGYYPAGLKAFPTVAPCFSIKAQVAFFKVIAAGLGISYGHTYHTKDLTRVVTVPVGYGDGYRRALSNCAHVVIRGKRYPVAGTVCMDQCMVDIGWDEAFVGDEVTLIGAQGNSEVTLQEISDLCQTIPYEILCGFNDRLPRMYLDK
jgi:alanine racemase